MAHHKRIIHEKRYYNCDQCDLSFRLPSILKNHVEKIHEEKFKCKFCNRNLQNENLLEFHIKSKHTKIYDVICDVCGKEFTNKPTLIRHKKAHHEGINVKCELCEKNYASEYLLKVCLEEINAVIPELGVFYRLRAIEVG